jgi:LPS O-antigen subunit length determinant protein (WzzB/FepE family)
MTDKNPTRPAAEQQTRETPSDEINLLEVAYVLIKYKLVIILFAVVGLAGGYMLARAKGPTYIGTAVIMAKDSDKPAMPNLGALGALGGFAAAQLNLAGNPGLDKIEIHFGSRQFRAELIEKYELLDDIYRLGAPKFYRRFFDTTAGQWLESETFAKPTPAKAADVFTRRFIGRDADTKRGTLTITVSSSDSAFTGKVIEGSLEHLNRYIQTDVQQDAKSNVDFLEQQLITIADPLLREKLQGMIAAEIEKAMLISREAFKVIDKPFIAKRHRERIMYPAAASLGMFMVSAAAVILLYYLAGGGNTSSEGRKWVTLIWRQMFRPF